MTIADALRGVPLFSGMADRSIDAVRELVHEVTFDRGEPLTEEGAPGETFLVLLDGAARVTQGGRHVRDLGAGDFLGEISLIDGGPRTATVVATSPIRALAIDHDSFSTLLERHPSVRLEILMAVTARLRTYGDPLA
jgi:CRP/FNR family transcriptional regulator, cyclic AMP receptor protein